MFKKQCKGKCKGKRGFVYGLVVNTPLSVSGRWFKIECRECITLICW